MYDASKVLYDAKTKYMKNQKVALTLVSAVKKLKPYFLAYQVIILIDQPLGKFSINLIC